MSNRIPRLAFVLISFALAVGLYWPALQGIPVWDDIIFWFKDPVITKEFSYLTIWKDFAWPFSVSLQKLLYGLLEKNYLYYHLLNLGLHFANAYLILKLAEKFKLPFARILFLVFLLHPSNVITVSWMIQLKTLLSFFFGILSFYFVTKSIDQKKWMIPAWLCFLLATLSKSSVLPLPVFLAFYLYKKFRLREFIWLLPFFLMSAFGTYRVLSSHITIQSLAKLEHTQPKAISAEGSGEIQPKKVETPKTEVSQVSTPAPEAPPKVAAGIWSKLKFRLNTFLGTTQYYFWQTLLPIENQPVKGLNYSPPGLLEYTHIFFLLLIIIINWKTATLFYLVSGYLFLLPFLGLLPAPYMNLTWVSDQHLYLALPFFISFWLSLLAKVKYQHASLFAWIFIPFYCFKIAVSSHYYKNEFQFFEASLEADAQNVPIAYNLAIAYLNNGQLNQAMNVASTIIHMAEISPSVRNNKYFPYMFVLYVQIQALVEKHEKN